MHVLLMMAQTADGFISRSSNEFIDWTGSSDKKMFMQITKKAGVVITGSKTYDTIGKPLPGRKNIVLTRNKERKSNHPDLVYTSDSVQNVLSTLQQEGFSQAVIIGGSEINSLFAKENLIDEIILTIAPRIFGQGLNLFNLSLDLQLELQSTKVIEENYIVLRYRVIKP